ncbi:DUF2513 domain-containing protein [Bacillus cereus group sp. BfR-BA-01315]|uniref:DUF2513 domain-containing protein n=1 Tax=Bacillus cereus group sp. BfR-BA-01315 TaxID=2920292 RepID=UPI001F592859|nr:DUF2513 domain-containing protein [Bacillus cereus group sp. BfR-BA-01315]
MKRDMELVKKLLLLIEEQTDDGIELDIPEGIDRINAANHLKLLEEAGLVKNNIQYGDNFPVCMFSSLTPEGHDFLDKIKNETVWSKLIEKIKEKGGEISFGFIKTFVFESAKKLL